MKKPYELALFFNDFQRLMDHIISFEYIFFHHTKYKLETETSIGSETFVAKHKITPLI